MYLCCFFLKHDRFCQNRGFARLCCSKNRSWMRFCKERSQGLQPHWLVNLVSVLFAVGCEMIDEADET